MGPKHNTRKSEREEKEWINGLLNKKGKILSFWIQITKEDDIFFLGVLFRSLEEGFDSFDGNH